MILPLATSTEFQRIFAGKECIWNLAQSDLTQCEILLMQMAVSDMPSVSLLTADDDYGKSFSDWFAYQAIELGLEVEDMVIYRNNEELKNGVAHFADKLSQWCVTVRLSQLPTSNYSMKPMTSWIEDRSDGLLF